MRQTWAKKVKHINYACTAGLVCRRRYLIVHHLNHSKIIFKYKQMLIFLVLDLWSINFSGDGTIQFSVKTGWPDDHLAGKKA
jgi:predicted component of viral defense system (DUF524 family)